MLIHHIIIFLLKKYIFTKNLKYFLSKYDIFFVFMMIIDHIYRKKHIFEKKFYLLNKLMKKT